MENDSPEALRADIEARKLRQNERRAKAGKPPMHKPKAVKRAPAARAGLPLPESGDIEDSAMSFDEWKSAGYTVKKGSKFHCTDILGVPQFILTQVQRTNPAWEKWRKRNPK